MKLNSIYSHFLAYFKKQPKELYAWEEIETSQEVTLGKDYIPDLNVNLLSAQPIIRILAYGDGLTVKKMQHYES